MKILLFAILFVCEISFSQKINTFLDVDFTMSKEKVLKVMSKKYEFVLVDVDSFSAAYHGGKYLSKNVSYINFCFFMGKLESFSIGFESSDRWPLDLVELSNRISDYYKKEPLKLTDDSRHWIIKNTRIDLDVYSYNDSRPSVTLISFAKNIKYTGVKNKKYMEMIRYKTKKIDAKIESLKTSKKE